MEGGLRVLLLARADDALVAKVSDITVGPGEPVDAHPGLLDPVALVVLDQTLRPDARETLEYFGRENVTVKVISGDNPLTVSRAAGMAHIAGAERYVDASTLDTPEAVAQAVKELAVKLTLLEGKGGRV